MRLAEPPPPQIKQPSAFHVALLLHSEPNFDKPLHQICGKATFYPVAASFKDENGNCDATGEPLRKGDFLSLAHNAPFGFAPNQLRGVRTGRFTAAPC